MSATCPIGDCGYAGKPASVEAHVSASTTGGHLGTLGREVREQIGGEAPWARLALIGGFLLALYLAQRGGSDPSEADTDDRAEEGGTMLVAPGVIAREAQEGGQR